ncbi:hypothetical protein B0A50_08037 [Salinomyces thailandicus]|uniref:Uncharacterized protein n=1 Tax=Salinomyces thailandicus TaxID=706561 RepID=A0A4U0TKS7_9PEZI|nr:hypothetical protein B0A50_08037 [Salinomyces thailandica]
MSPSLPPRKFTPVPFETSTRSSKDRQQSPDVDENPQPRRSPVEPVSAEQRSSKDRQPNDESKKPRSSRFAAKPVAKDVTSNGDKDKSEDAEKPQVRRFVPQLEVTEVKSSQDRTDNGEQPKPRRFAPQLVEHSSRKGSKESTTPGTSKFAPQLAETTFRSNRPGAGANGAPRRFTPVILDTARRSHRAGKEVPAKARQDFKTESGGQLHAREHRRHIRGSKTPVGEGDGGVAVDSTGADGLLDPARMLETHPELRRQVSPMDGSTPRRYSASSQRNHSYRTPGLESIESSESEPASQSSSLSSSPGQNGSPLTVSDSSFTEVYKHATRRRESVDETFQRYLLQLEAKKALQRFEEQALAAFPNSDFHEPVNHYVMDDDSSEDMEIDDRPVTWASYDEDILLSMAKRRESTAKGNWEQLEMQRHAERLEQERNAARTTAKQPTQSPWWQPDAYDVEQNDQELKSMQDRARPPMLGKDIVFPRSKSPEPARFDVTQGSATLRNQMCYLTEHANSRQSGDEEGLWRPPSPGNEHVAAARAKAAESPQHSTSAGLWGGLCVDDGEQGKQGMLGVPSGPTGLLTPRVSEPTINPFEQSFAAPSSVAVPTIGIKTPNTPPQDDQSSARIDNVVMGDRDLDDLMARDYPDAFITQVYNYLSLGYPSLARPFDAELAKISHIPLAELRKDDAVAKQSPKGYIRLGPDFEGGGGEGITEQECKRWQALRLYVREWARQEKDMVKIDGPGGNWGTGARRGSWAL